MYRVHHTLIKRIIIAIFVFALVVQGVSATVIFDGTWKSTDHWTSRNGAFGNYVYSCIVAADRLTIVDDPRGLNGKVGKFVTISGDQCNAASPSERAEVAVSPFGTEGSDLYYGWGILLPPDWIDNIPTEWSLIWQIHGASPPDTSLPVTISMHNSYSSNPRSVSSGSKDQINFPDQLMINQLSLNQWHYFVVRVKWASTSTGIVEIWYAGEDGVYTKLRTKTGYATIPVGGLGYLQYGFYRGHTTNTQTLYHSSLKIATTFNEVSYNGRAPIPTPSPTPTVTPTPTIPTNTIILTVNTVGIGSVDVVGYGTVTGSSSFSIPKNSAVTFISTPASGYTFSKYTDIWSTGTYETTVNPWTDTISASDTVTAYFVQSTTTPIPTVTIPQPFISPPHISTLLNSITTFLKGLFIWLPW